MLSGSYANLAELSAPPVLQVKIFSVSGGLVTRTPHKSCKRLAFQARGRLGRGFLGCVKSAEEGQINTRALRARRDEMGTPRTDAASRADQYSARVDTQLLDCFT